MLSLDPCPSTALPLLAAAAAFFFLSFWCGFSSSPTCFSLCIIHPRTSSIPKQYRPATTKTAAFSFWAVTLAPVLLLVVVRMMSTTPPGPFPTPIRRWLRRFSSGDGTSPWVVAFAVVISSVMAWYQPYVHEMWNVRF